MNTAEHWQFLLSKSVALPTVFFPRFLNCITHHNSTWVMMFSVLQVWSSAPQHPCYLATWQWHRGSGHNPESEALGVGLSPLFWDSLRVIPTCIQLWGSLLTNSSRPGCPTFCHCESWSFTVCWAAFVAVLGCLWPVDHSWTHPVTKEASLYLLQWNEISPSQVGLGVTHSRVYRGISLSEWVPTQCPEGPFSY